MAAMCLYAVENTSLDDCLPGIYEYIVMLLNGAISNPPRVGNNSEASICLSKAFSSCPRSSVMVINSLLKPLLNVSLSLNNTAYMARREYVEDSTSEIIKMCLTRIGPERLNNCISNFYPALMEVINQGQNTTSLEITSEGERCLGDAFNACSLRVRLLIMKTLFDYKGILINIPLVLQPDHIRVNKLVTEQEKCNIVHCFASLNETEVEICEPGFYRVLSELIEGSIKIPDTFFYNKRKCLEKAFKQCSIHSRLIIMDLVSLATDNAIDIPLHSQQEVMSPISVEERIVIRRCLSQLQPGIVEKCLPGLMHILMEVYHNNIPNLTIVPITISKISCLKKSFLNCSADSRLFLTELIYRYTNVFVDLLFFVTDDGVDADLLNIAYDCVSSIPASLIDGCINGLTYAMHILMRKVLPPLGFAFRLQERASPYCVKEVFMHCSRYHRILIDQLVRKMVRNFTNTAVFDILSPLKANTGVHEHSEADKELIHECFHTINPDYLNWCVPGFYEVLQALVGLEFPISVLTLKPIEGTCLELAFADCSYKSRILIKDLLYDFAYLFVNIPLKGAPRGKTGELGPPISAVRECISNVNATGSDSCVLGIVEYLHKVFIERVEKPEPIISLDKAKTSMSCLAELLKPCDLPMKLFLLKRIANISNVDIQFLMETFLIRPGESKQQ
ncbi:uncharacterized protein CDAR_124201 [Caerostris darwini]|uniref:Uncharacterized protein n=1 Tax=Caerostris darwini TaxID=1538125 RepID=A0AAV4R906_9ARAC|nr:uncharacterized protein CDAR_124201 [Caerostris darwini]